MSRAAIRDHQIRDPISSYQPPPPPGQQLPRWLWGLLVGGGIGLLLLGMALAPQARGNSTSEAIPGIPQEVIGPNRVVLREFPDRPWLSYYRAHAQWLGDPLWGERQYDVWPSCVGFTNYVICHNPEPAVRGTVWEWLPQLLGSKSLPTDTTPNPQAELAPIVQRYLAALQARGEDHWYRLGAVQSPAYCPQSGGECFQVFQLQVLRWSKGSEDPNAVRISPLGLQAKRG